MPKKVNFGEFLETWSLRSNPFVENAKIEKLKWDILCDFQTLCLRQSSVKLSNIFDNFLKTWKSTKWGHVLMQHPVVKKVVWAVQAEKSVCFLYVLCDYRWCP